MIGLLATTGRSVPVYDRAVSSANSFRQYFRDLKKADTMGPIERFVFSLALANSKAPKTDTQEMEAPPTEAPKAEATKTRASKADVPKANARWTGRT